MKKKLYIIVIIILLVVNFFLLYKPYSNANSKDAMPEEYKMTLLNPDIINTEFNEIGKLIVSEGKITYKNTISDKKWYSDRSITYEINYKYGIGIDLAKLTVDSISNNIVSITIPVNDVKLEYLEIQPNETKIDSKKSLLACQFKPEIMKTIIQTSEKDVYDSIVSDNKITKDSLNNLQENLSSIVKSLGFKDCYFKLII